MRLFVACDFSQDTLTKVGAISKELQEKLRGVPIRWVSPDLYHLTLQFLGEVPDVKIRHIAPRLAAVAENFPRIPVRLSGAGCFPSLRNAQTIWLGLDNNPKLRQLAEDLRGALLPLGFEDETRFKPHLTLGRLDRNASDEQKARVAQQVTAIKEFHAEPEYFRELILYQSVLTPSRPVYTALSRFPLKIC